MLSNQSDQPHVRVIQDGKPSRGIDPWPMREVRLSVEKAVEGGPAYVRLKQIFSLKIVCVKYMYGGFL